MIQGTGGQKHRACVLRMVFSPALPDASDSWETDQGSEGVWKGAWREGLARPLLRP